MSGHKHDIRLTGLSVGYGGKAVVSDVNVTLPGGKITVILGGSGCGKSTLLKHILRLHDPIAGAIHIGRHNIMELSRKQWACLKLRLGLLFQDGALLGSLTLGDNVALPLREHTRLKPRQAQEIAVAKLGLVGLENFAHLYPNQLSGGMRKRAGLARAMVMDPAILFCDEPTSGLDPINSAELDQLLLELKQRFDMTLVVVSHDLASMRTIADHVVVLGEGRVLFDGSLEELEATRDTYLRRFLDRLAEERDTPRLGTAQLDPSVMKMDCSRLLGGEAR
ncbi:phospholipid/cholesterol/gamma-HCH transport system ATP-binding protein [Paucidesulfovibrio gracilis DSM 16080]|uniref:Phospholipid/cholesterol/gamma-HCH transport system ATP-binding protein n=1 Tax=Paucidesulfovibrio gracilis DSM 16080 TaxID=1121449 RepID=A0A1T4Y623_9BACT|nr:ATP-binding cassette domain-containing protein [Paucidesulfovibrio gracilis]SKA97229.1 phospholipid/cholesterol/gamma-HCH transport system ATP-binding protein [Paucidesulfovibrio gracilis DSM 16080]